MLSSILLGFSSILLAGLQGISFWYQHKNIRFSTILITDLNNYMRGLTNYKINLYNALNRLDSNSLQESLQSLGKSDEFIIDLEMSNKNLDKSFDKFEKSFKDSYTVLSSEHIIIPSVIIFMLGIILISLYILLFMNDYVIDALN
jgi:hypothetical protein